MFAKPRCYLLWHDPISDSGLRDLDVPVQIVVGDADIVNPLAGNAKSYTDNIATARPLIILPGERGHYIKPSAPEVRAAELQEVAKLAVYFLKRYFNPVPMNRKIQ